jgi:nitrite reductase/ring-hydroxylating ferredoxin subunit
MSKLELGAPQPEDRPPFKTWLDYVREDRGQVSPHLFERGDDLGPVENFRIPASSYLSREVHEREVEHLWTKAWQMACRSNDLPKVGDYLEYEIVGRSIIVVRDTPTSIKAFRNACRHRGTALASGRGHASCFYCPFHGWRYGLDGRLEHLPAGWEFPHFDRSGLRPVRIEEFNGNVFVNLDDDAAPLKDQMGETLMRHLSVYPDDRMWKSWHFGIIVESNWKVMAEAFFETYHIPATHPEMLVGAADVQGQIDIFGLHHRQIALSYVSSFTPGVRYSEQEIIDTIMTAASGFVQIPDGEDPETPPAFSLPEGVTARQFITDAVRAGWAEKGLDLSKVSDTEIADVIGYMVFPNFLNFVGPGGHILYRFRPNGDDHTSMLYEVMGLTPIPGDGPMPPDAPLHMIPRGGTLEADEAACRVMGASLAYVFDQDVSNSARIQKGLKVADEVVLGATVERDIVAFHRNIDGWVAKRAAEAGG